MKKRKQNNESYIEDYLPNLKLINEIEDYSYTNEDLNNTFIIVKSLNNLLYLIYSTNNKSIICYNLNTNQTVNEIHNHHKKPITNFKHYSDIKNNKDLIMSISSKDNNIRIWSLNNWKCLHNLKVKYFGNIYTTNFINDNNEIYLITNINRDDDLNSIKVLDFNGNIIKNINGTTEIVCFIDVYYDQLFKKNYILFGKLGFCESYDYIKNKIYHRYLDKNGDHYAAHCSMVINESEKIINLIESSRDGNIRIWDFHTGISLSKIFLGKIWLNGICLWNEKYLFVGCDDHTIKLVDLKNKIVVNTLNGHKNSVLTIKRIFIPLYGDCIISQEKGNSQIKLWGK